MIQLNLGDTQGVMGRGVDKARFQVQRPSRTDSETLASLLPS